MIFVFGSNLDGLHGKGAARTAYRLHGAKMGIGEGRTGNSYALPTKGHNLVHMTKLEIEGYVKRFLVYAKSHPDQVFQVTRVGCGLAGHQDYQIAPMFMDAPDNCLFDRVWAPYLPKLTDKRFWN